MTLTCTDNVHMFLQADVQDSTAKEGANPITNSTHNAAASTTDKISLAAAATANPVAPARIAVSAQGNTAANMSGSKQGTWADLPGSLNAGPVHSDNYVTYVQQQLATVTAVQQWAAPVQQEGSQHTVCNGSQPYTQPDNGQYSSCDQRSHTDCFPYNQPYNYSPYNPQSAPARVIGMTEGGGFYHSDTQPFEQLVRPADIYSPMTSPSSTDTTRQDVRPVYTHQAGVDY